MEKSVLVTGASGFLGSWVVRRFLAAGWSVYGTVRDSTASHKTDHLLALGREHAGSLTLLEADLLHFGSFDDAANQVSTVVHTASPFTIDRVEDPHKELLQPAVRGTENVLSAANRARSVERVVLTSSVVAVHGDAIEVRRTEEGFFDEGDWNQTSSLDYQPYSFAKTEAERRARELARDASWRLVSLNPGFIIGPSLSGRADSASTILVRRLLNGEFSSGVPALSFGLVDVRDVAEAHYRAATVADPPDRSILVATHGSLLEMGQAVDKIFPGTHAVPQKEVAKPILYLLSRKLGLSWRYIRRNVGIPVRYDNRRSKTTLGMSYRPMEESLRDQRLQLVEDGLLRPRMVGKE